MTTRTDPGPREVAAAMGAEDLMVFELRGGRAHLRGGVGRGASWAGVVELDPSTEPLLHELLAQRRVVRVNSSEAVHVAGPYWSAHAALAASGEHVMIVGATAPIRTSSAELVRRVTEAVAALDEISPSKLLADELELVEAVRQLTDHVPRTIAETATHAAAVAADALSCEIGAVLLHHGGHIRVHGAGDAWATVADDPVLGEALHALAQRAADGPIVEQDIAAVGSSGLRIVSCYALGIGRSEPIGTLIVGHTDQRPRGFTLLCQRVGRALADAAEPALLQAIAHEDLAAQRDRFALEARTDPLTGLPNRVHWDATLALEHARRSRQDRRIVVLAMDLDGLKAINDAHGHTVGDELLIAAADIMRRSLRGGDVIVRLGGDEFAALLADADASAAAAVRRRIDAACATWRGSRPDARLSISMGCAVPRPGEPLGDAFARADAAMYEAKRGVTAPRRETADGPRRRG